MTTDNKTLAAVQPGGRVRLGDQAERARFEAFLSRNPLTALCAGTAWEVWQAALSAQPSPGGQGGDDIEQLRVQLAGCGVVALSNTRESLKEQMPEKGAYGWSESLLQVRESVLREIHQRERAEAAEQVLEMAASSLPADVLHKIAAFFYDGPYRSHKMVAVMEAALAARQPVGEPVAWYYGFSDTGEAGPVTFGGTPGAEAIAWAERHGHTLHYLYAAPPAQVVDLAENVLSVLIEEGVLSRNGRVFKKLRALIDSHTAGGQP